MGRSGMSSAQVDVLREVGGVSVAHAVTTIADLVGERIDLSIPQVEILDVSQVASLIGDDEMLVAAAYSAVEGDVPGGILFVADPQTALRLVALSLGRDPEDAPATLSGSAEAHFRHLASLAIGSCVSAFARFTTLDLLPGGSSYAFDMAGALIEAAVLEYGTRAEEVTLVHATMLQEGDLPGAAMILIPDPDGLQPMFARLGVA